MTVPPENDPMAQVRPYIQLASGLLGMSAAKAAELAQGIWAQGSDVVDDGMQAAQDAGGQIAALLSPEQVRVIVREEVDKAARRMGFARDDEVASLRREVTRLEHQVSDLAARVQSIDEERAAKQAKKDAKKDSKKGKHGSGSSAGDSS